MIDLQTVNNIYQRFEVSNVAGIRSEHDIAKSLTTIKANYALLLTLPSTTHSHPVKQWIVHSDPKRVTVKKNEGVTEWKYACLTNA